MPLPTDPHAAAVGQEAVQALDDLNGRHPGFRPAHSKGVILSGVFTPAPAALSLSRAPHLKRESTPVSVRFSDFAGVPNIPDNHPQGGSPRGCAIRFHLADRVHTDIVAHSADGFPVRTADEFVEFLKAVKANTIEAFLGSHPKAREFVMTPKPFPTSFARESYFAVTAYRFLTAGGASQFGRYKIRPDEGGQYLDDAAAAAQTPNYLFEELAARIAQGPVKLHIVVQLAGAGDVVDDATAHWAEGGAEAAFGTLELTRIIPEDDSESRRIIFDPIPRVDGIEPSADPLLDPRAAAYLIAGKRRRAEIQA